jgi:hypothetical protein
MPEISLSNSLFINSVRTPRKTRCDLITMLLVLFEEVVGVYCENLNETHK